MHERIGSLLNQFATIERALSAQIGGKRVPLPAPDIVSSLAALKRYEDALDALICGWVGIQFTAGNAVAYGDATAAVWVPSSLLGSDSSG